MVATLGFLVKVMNRDTSISDSARAMASLIRRFVSGEVTPYEWDDFMGIAFSDPWLEQMRIRASTIADTSPVDSTTGSDEGAARLLELAQHLENEAANRTVND